jgi:septal ring factor EnvC (AmiA/AmiB activator)
MTPSWKLNGVLTAFVLGASLIACTSDTAREAERKQSEAAADVAEMRRQARAEMKEQIDDLERRLTQLRQEADQAGGKVEQSWNESVADLERKTADLRREWEQMENQSEDAWDAFSERARRAVAEIESGLKEASDKIG